MKFIKELSKNTHSDILPLKIINTYMADKSVDARKSFLKRATQKGDLIRLKNGLYLLGEEYRKNSYNPFEIANFIQEPSYVSMESALSYYGLIPEAVYTTTSVTTKSNLEQDTSIGHFSYSYLKTKYFNFGFYQAKEGDHKFLIATPFKALMDFIVIQKKAYKTIYDLEEDLRFDFDEFVTLKKFVNKKIINEMLKIYKSYRLQVILKEIRRAHE